MRPDFDVLIAGAGPGGTATAQRLVQREAAPPERVAVFDRCTFPRPKPCGGGLTGHADAVMAELGIELEVPAWSAAGARVRFGQFERDVRLQNPVRIVRREDFDCSLVRAVQRRGVQVIEGEGIADYRVTDDAVIVRTSTGREVSARVLVGADGAASIVRKRLHDNRRGVPHRLFKLEMTVPAGRPIAPHMLYDFSLMTRGLRGYLWIFPVPGNLINVGLMHYPSRMRKSGGELTELLRVGLAEHGIELPERGTRGWPAWGYHPKAPVSSPRVLTVGDAAGIDGLTGEGIAVAMEQAVVAGDLIARGFSTGDLEFAGYRAQLRRAVVGRELALDRWLARLLYGGKRRWRHWLSLVLFDDQVLEMYAARVSGSSVLADQKARLYRALARHIVRLPSRRRQLAAAAENPALLPAAVGAR